MRRNHTFDRKLSADEVIAQALAQHAHLRDLFANSVSSAQRALEGEPTAIAALGPTLARARAAFEGHLMFEESLVIPLLREDPPVGPHRAERVLDEHERQRQMLSTLSREVNAYPDLPTVALKLEFLLRWLLEDMEAEERNLLHRDVLREDPVTIDQVTG